MSRQMQRLRSTDQISPILLQWPTPSITITARLNVPKIIQEDTTPSLTKRLLQPKKIRSSITMQFHFDPDPMLIYTVELRSLIVYPYLNFRLIRPMVNSI